MMFLWLLKLAYGASFVEAHRNMANRNDIRLGTVMSRVGFQRLQLFHQRVLREYCRHGSINHLRLMPFSLVRARITDQGLYFSRSSVRNRVTVAWGGQVFRLTLDRGREEQLAHEGVTQFTGAQFGAFMSSNDLFTPESVQYPRLKRGRQRMSNATPRRMQRNDRILITQAGRTDQTTFMFSGHLLENGGIVAEENSIQIVVRRTKENERINRDEFEVQQPGLQLVTKTVSATMDYREQLGMPDTGPLSDEEELRMMLFILHEVFKVTFRINPPVGLNPSEIP